MALIVVAEDDSGTLKLIQVVLRNQGHDVLSASDGQRAWLLIREHRPDLVVSDINMPGITGFELLRAVRDNEQLNQIPFVLLTSLQERRDMRQGMLLGADDYLTKPVRPHELVDAVTAQLNRQTMRAASFELQVRDAVSEALEDQAWILQAQYEKRLARELSEQWPGEHRGHQEERHTHATVLFADIRQYADWLSVLDTEQFASLLKRFYEGSGDTVHLFGARALNFVGDGLMAVFTDLGPGTTAHQGLRAVKAAFGLRNAAAAMQGFVRQRFPGRMLPAFAVGTALHSGPVTMMRLDGLLGGASQVLPVGEAVVDTIAIQRQAPEGHGVTVSVPVLRSVMGAVHPVSRHFVYLPHRSEPLEVCAVDPLPA